MNARFTLPDLGEGLQEAEIVAWHVSAGDHVVADQPLLSVETDKAVVEIPSPRAGHIAELHGAPGDVVMVGAALVDFEAGPAADTGTVVGEIETAPEVAQAKPIAAPRPPAAPGVKAAPAVRALAGRLGVDLSEVAGSGPDGAVTSADVEAAAGTPDNWRPLGGVRRAMARNMERAREKVITATITDDADVEAWTPGGDVTMRLIRAMAAGCRAEPALNAWYDNDRRARVLHEHIDIGIAVETEDGLFAPVMRDVGNRDAGDLSGGFEVLKADVRARTVPREELRGQTITLSNFGMFGGRYAALVVVPPQVAILGAGAIRPHVVAVDGAPAVRRMLPLSLSFDHHAVTGAEAARFLAAAVADLDKPD
jgi:pyruvate dehydrogenase E2 component (dihydrolipoamide acetyltransferase)